MLMYGANYCSSDTIDHFTPFENSIQQNYLPASCQNRKRKFLIQYVIRLVNHISSKDSETTAGL